MGIIKKVLSAPAKAASGTLKAASSITKKLAAPLPKPLEKIATIPGRAAEKAGDIAKKGAEKAGGAVESGVKKVAGAVVGKKEMSVGEPASPAAATQMPKPLEARRGWKKKSIFSAIARGGRASTMMSRAGETSSSGQTLG